MQSPAPQHCPLTQAEPFLGLSTTQMSKTGKSFPHSVRVLYWPAVGINHRLLHDFLAPTVYIISQWVGWVIYAWERPGETAEGLTLQWAERKHNRAEGSQRSQRLWLTGRGCTKTGLSTRPTGISLGRFFPQKQAREGASPFPSGSGSGDCPARRGIAIVRPIVSSLAKNGMTGD